MALENKHPTGWSGNPPTDGVSNKHDGTGNPNMGEASDLDPKIAPNMFPRETGHDSLTEEEAQLT